MFSMKGYQKEYATGVDKSRIKHRITVIIRERFISFILCDAFTGTQITYYNYIKKRTSRKEPATITYFAGGITLKKILLVGMLVVSGLSFGRDFEYRERQELQVVQETPQMDIFSRERDSSEYNRDVYSYFHNELDNMSRGHENK